MSFSADVKTELANLPLKRPCCRLAECHALVKATGSLVIAGGEIQLKLLTENPALARRMFSLLKKVLGVEPRILIRMGARFSRRKVYELWTHDPGATAAALERLGVLGKGGIIRRGINRQLVSNPCCRKSYLRGYFLGAGSVLSPERHHHLELEIEYGDHARDMRDLLGEFGLKAGKELRRDRHVLYIKDAGAIARFLGVVGAHAAMLRYENARILKELKNDVNRRVNFETANLGKVAHAAGRQIRYIRFIDDRLGLGKLPRALKELAHLRLRHPEACLRELGEMMDPPVSKSGVNQRMRRLERLARSLLKGKGLSP